jgi:hypothetical protein
MDVKVFSPGFRITGKDKWVLLSGGFLAIVLVPFDRLMAFAVVSATAHFFLFCNVFRIPRTPELIWAGAFLLAMLLVIEGRLELWHAVALLEALACGLILNCMRHPSYHGVDWKKVNSNLPEWWKQEESKTKLGRPY